MCTCSTFLLPFSPFACLFYSPTLCGGALNSFHQPLSSCPLLLWVIWLIWYDQQTSNLTPSAYNHTLIACDPLTINWQPLLVLCEPHDGFRTDHVLHEACLGLSSAEMNTTTDSAQDPIVSSARRAFCARACAFIVWVDFVRLGARNKSQMSGVCVACAKSVHEKWRDQFVSLSVRWTGMMHECQLETFNMTMPLIRAHTHTHSRDFLTVGCLQAYINSP